MATEFLRDKYGNVVGRVERDGSGREVLRDKVGDRVANWDPNDNHGTLRDKNGNPISHNKW